jgi:tetratricopeptide (TPR) repeat protein
MNRTIRGLALLLALVCAHAPFGSLALAQGRSAADGRWTMVRGQDMTVVGDQPAATLRDIAERLERFRAGLSGLIPNAERPPPVPTVVFVFGTRKAMQPFLPLTRNGKPAPLGGFFHRDADVNYIALSLEGFDESLPVVFHEYTHLLVRNAVRSVPVWLNEGLAEYYSTFTMSGNVVSVDVGRPIVSHVRLLRERYMPIADLIAVDAGSELYDEAVRRSIFYAESWALIHYLMVEVPDGPASINRYVADIAGGRRPGDAFFDAFGMSPQKFDEQLKRYVAHPMFRWRTFNVAERARVDVSDQGRALSAGEADAWLGDLQRRIRRKREAAVRIEAALRQDAEAAITHLALGLLRIDEGRISESWAALERAVAIAPDDFMTQYAYGASLLREAAQVDGLVADATALAHSQTALRAATTINPYASEAWSWLAYANMLDDDQLPAAEEAINHAIELAPGRLEYRLRWADISILRGHVADARKLLTELAALTTDRTVSEAAQRRLDALARSR